MARTSVISAIERAYTLIGVKGSNEDLPAYRKTEGLKTLNFRLQNYANDSAKVPYTKEVTFNTIANQDSYTIGIGKDVDTKKLVSLEYVKLSENSYQYCLDVLDKESFYNNDRNLNSYGRPCFYYFNQELDNSKITFLPTPERIYEILLVGKFEVYPLIISDDLDIIVPAGWDEFVIYDLARALRDIYPSAVWDGGKENRYQELSNEIQSASECNLYPIVDGRLSDSFDARGYDYVKKPFV